MEGNFNRDRDINRDREFQVYNTNNLNCDNTSTSKLNLTNSAYTNVNPSDIIKLTLQFLRENGLVNSANTLENESGIKLNAVDSIDRFRNDIISGQWQNILRDIDGVEIKSDVLVDLYENIIYDLIENDDREVASVFLTRVSIASNLLKFDHGEWYRKMEEYIGRSGSINTGYTIGDIYMKEDYDMNIRRSLLADKLCMEVYEAKPMRLVNLIESGMKAELAANTKYTINGSTYVYDYDEMISSYDIFSGKKTDKTDKNNFLEKNKTEPNIHPKATLDKLPSLIPQINDSTPTPKYIQNLHKQLLFTPPIQTAKFSANNKYFATGNSMGAIEIFNTTDFILHPDLPYQQSNSLLGHKDNTPISCINFNKDSNMLISGDMKGLVKVFKIANGKCLREFQDSAGISCLTFSNDNSQIITGSYDNSIKILGLKAGRILHEINLHKAYVNCVSLMRNLFISGSADGEVKLFDKNYDLISVSDIITSNIKGQSVNYIMPILGNTPDMDTIIISTASNNIYEIMMNGNVKRVFCTGKKECIVSCVYNYITPYNEYLYAVDEAGVLYAFEYSTGIIRNFMNVGDKALIGMVGSSGIDSDKIDKSLSAQLIACYFIDGSVRIFN